jgi:hypothetical protein
VAWRSRGSGRRRARPPARGATRRATRPRWRTGAGSACSMRRFRSRWRSVGTHMDGQ